MPAKKKKKAPRGRKTTLYRKIGKRNVAMGFYDLSGFHPLRRSADYDPDRAGDEYSQRSGKKRKATKKRSGAKKGTAKKKKKSTARSKGNPGAKLKANIAKMKPRSWYDTTLSGAKVKVKRVGQSLVIKPATKRRKR